MMSNSFSTKSVIQYYGSSSRWVRYGIVFAGLSLLYLPAIEFWGRGGLLLYFFAIILIESRIGLKSSFFALIFLLIGINYYLFAPLWHSNPYDALFLNSGFCLITAVIIAVSRFHHLEAIALLENKQDLDLAQSVAQVGSWRFKADEKKVFWTDEKYRIFEIDKRH